MAAPVAHIVAALTLLNSGTQIADRSAFIAGTSFPDIRYITDVKRTTTHHMDGEGIEHVLSAPDSFEAGRRYHVFIDQVRERHMVKNNAYQFFSKGPLKTQMLKIIEDHILFGRLKNSVDGKSIFNKIYDGERAFSLTESDITTWHNLLRTYLSQSYYFNCFRYYQTLLQFQHAHGLPQNIFKRLWVRIKTMGFFIYAYYRVEQLSRNKELRTIILDFYDKKLPQLIKDKQDLKNELTVEYHRAAPPLKSG